MMSRAAWLVLGVMVCGCAPIDTRTTKSDAPWYRAVTEPSLSDADRILRYYDRISAMKPQELAHELEVARESFESSKSPLSRMQLALLLSYPGSTFRDDNAAMSLLGPLTRDKAQEATSLRALAIWLNTELLEARRADEALQQQSAKMKEDQRRVEVMQQKADALQQKAEALQQKLDAILDMEMKMIEREQNIPKKK